jgi:nucleotide-binding universal stress UspA family protein
LRHVVEGSDAEKIIHQAPCPVLIVRENEHDFVS